MNDLLNDIEAYIALEQKLKTKIEALFRNDFSRNYYYLFEKRQANTDTQLLWFSFYIPVLEIDNTTKVMELSFNTYLDDENKITDFEVDTIVNTLSSMNALYIYFGNDLNKFKHIPNIGGMDLSLLQKNKNRIQTLIKEKTSTTSISKFIQTVANNHILEFLKDIQFTQDSESKNLVPVDEMNKKIQEITSSIDSGQLYSPDVDKEFFNSLIKVIKKHDSVNFKDHLSSELPFKSQSRKPKV